MAKKEKATEGYAPAAASKTDIEINNNAIHAFIKTVIVYLGIRSLVPTNVADWLIKNLGLKGA
ncbi:hypothetical protein [Candidatus Berkiella aquae]|uniref:Uncharacterized protein n=1 Tax=Candidatus Berkiella aquae TaxID=295108 RepID=A0A0Q9YY39_9GAMM|nr:hypothetical protein [Candidatus Berkiella aquae]MCS5710439.1 hypothetical protein [Candidatus Berkiella aquae]